MKKGIQADKIERTASNDTSKVLDLLLNHLKKEHHFSDEEINKILASESKPSAMQIPISIFNNELSSLETIVKYLHENSGMKFSDIANNLNRSVRTIYTTYQNAKDKLPKKMIPSKDELYFVPAEDFCDRKFSPLEIVVKHLKESYGLSIKDISKIIKRNSSTVWTVYNRGKRKGKK